MIIVYTFAEEDRVIFVKSYPSLRESWEASRSTWQDRSSRMQKRNSPTLWDIKPRILYPLRSLQSCPPSPRDASPIPISLLDPAMSRSSFPIRTAETLDQGGSFPSTVPVSRCYREISLFLLTAVCSKQYRGQRCRLSSFLHASFVNVSRDVKLCEMQLRHEDEWSLVLEFPSMFDRKIIFRIQQLITKVVRIFLRIDIESNGNFLKISSRSRKKSSRQSI